MNEKVEANGGGEGRPLSQAAVEDEYEHGA